MAATQCGGMTGTRETRYSFVPGASPSVWRAAAASLVLCLTSWRWKACSRSARSLSASIMAAAVGLLTLSRRTDAANERESWTTAHTSGSLAGVPRGAWGSTPTHRTSMSPHAIHTLWRPTTSVAMVCAAAT